MKVAYISSLPFADFDFPLIKELQKQGVDVYYYIYLDCFALKASIFNIKKQYEKDGIYSATIYKEFRAYKGYFNLDHVYVINRTHKSALHPSTIALYIKLTRIIKHLKADIVHITNPLGRVQQFLYILKSKMVLTVHDPFVHSSKGNWETETNRTIAFKFVKRLIMLNKNQIDEFCATYNYERNNILVSHMGEYDCIRGVTPLPVDGIKNKYILYFGLISPYKGIEYLLEAFDTVHEKFPDVKLVIAGGGRLYFDESLYKGKDYIIIKNRYITLQELSWLLKSTQFAVLPYKDATQSGVVQTAFSMSTPLVVTNVGALPDAVTDNETGIVVPPLQSDKLADAMIYLLDNPTEIERMKHNIETIWRNKMSWTPITKEYIKFYQSFINSRA